jgi:hypothetical protein
MKIEGEIKQTQFIEAIKAYLSNKHSITDIQIKSISLVTKSNNSSSTNFYSSAELIEDIEIKFIGELN